MLKINAVSISSYSTLILIFMHHRNQSHELLTLHKLRKWWCLRLSRKAWVHHMVKSKFIFNVHIINWKPQTRLTFAIYIILITCTCTWRLKFSRGRELLFLILYLLYSISHEPTTSADIIRLLQKECGLKIPASEEEWGEIPRTTIDIRRSMVVKDGLREARKSRFDMTKLLNVNTFTIDYRATYIYISSSIIYAFTVTMAHVHLHL